MLMDLMPLVGRIAGALERIATAQERTAAAQERIANMAERDPLASLEQIMATPEPKPAPPADDEFVGIPPDMEWMRQ